MIPSTLSPTILPNLQSSTIPSRGPSFSLTAPSSFSAIPTLVPNRLLSSIPSHLLQATTTTSFFPVPIQSAQILDKIPTSIQLSSFTPSIQTQSPSMTKNPTTSTSTTATIYALLNTDTLPIMIVLITFFTVGFMHCNRLCFCYKMSKKSKKSFVKPMQAIVFIKSIWIMIIHI